MDRGELKEIIQKIMDRLADAPAAAAARPACVFNDTPCDATTWYSVGEEA